MPKAKVDALLINEIQAFVKEVGGFSIAARILNVEKTMLWRFHQKGCAIDRNRLLLREALERYRNATNAQKATPSVAKTAMTTSATVVPVLQGEDLAKMRLFFQNMLALVDVYEMSAFNTLRPQSDIQTSGVSK